MTTAVHEVLPIVFFLVVGWLTLWPLRNRLGAGWYHLAALPVALLASSLAGAVSTVTGRPLDIASACAGALLLASVGWSVALFVVAPAPDNAPAVGARSYGITAGLVVILGMVLGLARTVITNNDSFMSYWPFGLLLSWKGAFTATLMSSRGPLITAMNAIHADFGSNFAFVIYPLLGATVLAVTGLSLWTGPLSGASPRTKKLVTGAALGFLTIEPSFIFQSLFVHSQMMTAMYLLLAGVSLWLATPKAVSSEKVTPNDAFLVLAGFAASGLALARPDGLAYMFVPVALALSVLTISMVSWRSVLSFFIPMVFVVVGTYAAAFAKLGLWHAPKLGGKTSLAILCVLVFAAVAPWIIQWLDERLPFRVRGEKFLGLLVGMSAIGVLIVFALKWDTASGALTTARINLLQGHGGYFYLWYAVAILCVLALFSGDALRPRSWTRSPFLAVALFFVIAAMVHGLTHEGRVGPGDSFSRVAFEAVPIIVWFVAAVVVRILAPAGDGSQPAVEVEESP